MAAGFFCMTLIPSPVPMMIVSGVLLGSGGSPFFILLFPVAWAHFENRAGLVTGLITCGLNIARTVFPPIFTYIVNPNDLPNKANEKDG